MALARHGRNRLPLFRVRVHRPRPSRRARVSHCARASLTPRARAGVEGDRPVPPRRQALLAAAGDAHSRVAAGCVRGQGAAGHDGVCLRVVGGCGRDAGEPALWRGAVEIARARGASPQGGRVACGGRGAEGGARASGR
eukprot:1856242-Prymnesium_polylepis.1